MIKRASGILLHITSLPSLFGIGDLGPEAYRFADFLTRTSQHVWQILPLSPVTPAHGCSPYYSTSAFAGNKFLISPELLFMEGLLKSSDIKPFQELSTGSVNFIKSIAIKNKLLELAYRRFKVSKYLSDFERFCRFNAWWLDDFALFASLRTYFRDSPWSHWPAGLRNRNLPSLKTASCRLSQTIDREKFFQYEFHLQWSRLKRYCNRMQIQLFGDIPIYMPYDSADLWINTELFKLDSRKMPRSVSGVPPDYFSRTGQLWGHPVYDWEALRQSGYAWWIHRMRRNLALYDIVRIDHFRAFSACWEVPAGEKTARNGKWVDVPGVDFFNHIARNFPSLPVVAEDLGTITADVRELMRQFEFPGMKVLLFAFGDDFPDSAYLPHHMLPHCVVYTGTHDNPTVRGWFEDPENGAVRRNVCRYIGRDVPAETIHIEMIRMALQSVAKLAIIPMQDVLGLGNTARMNHPAQSKGNWKWQMRSDQITPAVTDMLLEMTQTYGRA